MKRVMYLFVLAALASATTACSGDSPTTPTTPAANAPATYSATLRPASEVPPVTGNEAAGSATATLTFNLTKDASGTTNAATLDVTVNATGFPAGMSLTASHVHPGAAGSNGGVLVSLGLTAGEVTFATGSGSFSKRGIAVPVDQANAIIANPGGFYLNIHTAANPNGVARGQLVRN